MRYILFVFILYCTLFYGDFASPVPVRDDATYEKCGENVDWTFDETSNILKFNGTGDMSFVPMWTDVPWIRYMDSIKGFEMNGNITSIPAFAFYKCGGLTTVNIPESVAVVGRSSFAYCNNLTVLNVSSSVKSWGDEVTKGCSNLKEIAVSDGNSVLKSVDGVLCNKQGTKIIQYPCGKNTTNYNIPDNVTEIGSSAFEGCNALESIIIPDNVITVGPYSFKDCTSLTSVVIPPSVKEIQGQAFYECSRLQSINIPENVTKISHSTFKGCTSLISIILPQNIAEIENWAFYECNGLKSINIPDSVTSIGPRAFYGCTSLTSVVLPKSLVEIQSETFYGCSGLQSVMIPGNVTKIGPNAFRECSLLTSIVLPQSVVEIEYAAFYECKRLQSINIPDNVTKIGSSAFRGCSSLTSIDLPPNITEVENTTFYGCSRLESINIPDNVIKISPYAFRDCRSLTSVTLSQSITEIGSQAFFGCNGLKSIIIPDNVTKIGSWAFSSCSSLTSIVIPKNVNSVDNNAFGDCSNLKYVIYDGNEDPSTSGTVFERCPLSYVCVPTDYINSTFCGVGVGKSSSCSMLINKCFISEYDGSKWNTTKKEEMIEWENKTNECVRFYCDNETGNQTRNQCGGTDVCIDDKCTNGEEENTELNVIIEFDDTNEIKISDFDSDEFKNSVFNLTSLTSSDMKMRIGIKIDENGKVVSIIIYIDDKDKADKIVSSINNINHDGKCDEGYGILCRTTNVYIKSRQMIISLGTNIVVIPYLVVLVSTSTISSLMS